MLQQQTITENMRKIDESVIEAVVGIVTFTAPDSIVEHTQDYIKKGLLLEGPPY